MKRIGILRKEAAMYIENIGLVDSDGNVTITEEQLMHRKEGFWACHISKGE